MESKDRTMTVLRFGATKPLGEVDGAPVATFAT
jgi:hypothetical protein